MPRGGRREGGGRKPASRAVSTVSEAPRSALPAGQTVGKVTLTAAQHREQLRAVMGTWATPQRFRQWLERLDAISREGKGAERFRALDLLVRMVIGNPAVHGDAEAGGGAQADGAEALRQMAAALPPGFALVHAQDTDDRRPGVYAEPPASPSVVIDATPTD